MGKIKHTPNIENLLLENARLKKELAQNQKLLKDKQYFFDILLETTLAGYWDWDVQEDFIYLSPDFKAMFGYEDHEIGNTTAVWEKIVHPMDLKALYVSFEKHVATRGEFKHLKEARYIHKDGTYVWFFCAGKVVKWAEDGSPLRMIGSQIDITALKKTQMELLQQTKVLANKNDELEQINYVASHDLQEPLRTVTSFAGLLEKRFASELNEDGKLYIKYIKESSVRMRELIKDLLEYSQIGSNKKTETFDCNELVKSIQTDLSTTISESKAEIRLTDLPLIKGHKTEIRQLFQNLISNALKFIPPRNQPKIEVGSIKKENDWLFFVKDNGIGIEKTYQEKIFIIFQRLNTQSEYEGTGIGLAQCKKIVELHKGKLWVESRFGEGSTFYFSIPNI